jgi:lipoprotein-anchoring transpeptidase ErfK/SrfK/frataxin-like iron-binding protein CyaY
MNMQAINRRDFLKYSALYSAGLWMAGSRSRSKYAFSQQTTEEGNKLGRVLFNDVAVYNRPDLNEPAVLTLNFNDVVQYTREQALNNGTPHQEIWCRLSDGNYYVLYKFLQPVENLLNEPMMEIQAGGQLAEVTVPYTTAVVDKNNSSQRETNDQMFFYGSTHWVYGLGKDESNNLYYQVREDRWDDSYYVRATDLRLVNDEELTPTDIDVDQKEKVIRINLEEQYLVAYENEKPVFMSALSSGQLTGDVDLTTPQGNFIVNYKRPSRHMVHTDRISINDNELYGVPWVSYFTSSGIAFHGTYWHNDFSKPNSHGCINLPIPAARWIYLWTQPVVPPREKKYVSNSGTQVEVY